MATRSESAARRVLSKMGYTLKKNAHKLQIDPYHSGCYQIVNSLFNRIEAGEHYDLTLDDVWGFING